MNDQAGTTDSANPQQNSTQGTSALRQRIEQRSLPKLNFAQERVFRMLVLALTEADEINRTRKKAGLARNARRSKSPRRNADARIGCDETTAQAAPTDAPAMPHLENLESRGMHQKKSKK